MSVLSRLEVPVVEGPVDVHAHGHFVVLSERPLGRGKPRLVSLVPVSREHALLLKGRKRLMDRFAMLGCPGDVLLGMNWVPRGVIHVQTSAAELKRLGLHLGTVFIDTPLPKESWTRLEGTALVDARSAIARYKRHPTFRV